MTNKIYGKMIYEDIEKCVKEFISDHQFNLPSISNWGRNYVIIRDKGVLIIVSKKEFNKVLDRVILRKNVLSTMKPGKST